MNFLRKFMYGRYGSYGLDQLSRLLLLAYLALYLLHLLLRWKLLSVLSLVLAAFALYRLLSRDIPRRQGENARYLSLTAPLRSWFRTRKMVHSDKAHRYFRCPNCGQQLRVPRGQGKIKVTCRACGTSFEEQS